jgi:metal-responsive CopG/Arc/MetJ family transcriptional regulator
MRITVHVPEKIGKEVQRLAENGKQSVSSVVAQSIEFFIDEKRRRQLGERVLKLAGKTNVADDIFDELHRGRVDHDRS